MNFKHGHTKRGSVETREYRTWSSMKLRCLNQKHNGYERYGGRGIKICERWLGPDGFINFLADMGGPRPDGMTLDGNGNYQPSNCRWATPREQQNNQTSCRLVTFNGETRTVTEWARHIGVSPPTLLSRLNGGWSVERALLKPTRQPIMRDKVLAAFDADPQRTSLKIASLVSVDAAYVRAILRRYGRKLARPQGHNKLPSDMVNGAPR